jgi:hypothetical protein
MENGLPSRLVVVVVVLLWRLLVVLRSICLLFQVCCCELGIGNKIFSFHPSPLSLHIALVGIWLFFLFSGFVLVGLGIQVTGRKTIEEKCRALRKSGCFRRNLLIRNARRSFEQERFGFCRTLARH